MDLRKDMKEQNQSNGGILQYFWEKRESCVPRKSCAENADHILKEVWFSFRALFQRLLSASVLTAETALSSLVISELRVPIQD